MKALTAALALFLAAGPALAGDPGRAALFIDAIRANGCAMTEAEAAETLPGLGFDQDETRLLVEVLYEATLVGFSENWDSLILAQELCEADPAQDEGTYAEALAAFEAAPRGPEPLSEDEALAVLRDDLGLDFLRDFGAYIASAHGCGFDLDDPQASDALLVHFVSDYMSQIYGVPLPAPEALAGEIETLVAAFLADPGPTFAVEPGRLSVIDCIPLAD